MSPATWFDLDGTLVRYDGDLDALVADVIGVSAGHAAIETLRERLFVALDEVDPAPFERAYGEVADRHDLALDAEAAATEHHRREVALSRRVEGARAVLQACGARGPVGVITNGHGPIQRDKLAEHDLDGLLDTVVVSNEVGLRKPDVAIFEAAAERIEADRHVYVGDAYEDDIQPAREAGFHAVHVRHGGGPPVSVATLADLLPLVDGRGEGH